MTLIRIIYNGQRPRTRRTANYILHNVIPTRCTREDMHSYKERESTAGQPIDSLLLDAISEDGKVCNRHDRPAGEHCLTVPEHNNAH